MLGLDFCMSEEFALTPSDLQTRNLEKKKTTLFDIFLHINSERKLYC